MSYVPLWCKSNYSFLEGASHPEELIERAAELGLSAIAITDRMGVYGVVRAHVRARELGVRLLVGAEVHFAGSRVVLLAMDRDGYGNLCTLLTRGRLRAPKGQCVLAADDVCAHHDGLLALAIDPAGLDAVIGAYGDRAYAMVARHRRAEEIESEARLRVRAAALGVPVVAAVEVLYHTRARRPLQDVLACMRAGATVHNAAAHTRPNAEHDLKTGPAFAALFADDEGAVARTEEVAARCVFSLDHLRYRYPSERLPDGTTSAQWLRALTHEGAKRRYGESVPASLTKQIEVELDLIEELDYPGYFLTMHEIVAYCRAHDILCQGRGSAANSAVCYCLGITAVDPTRIDLLFERFLSRERHEPPDIDLDIAHERREEVIQHVYGKYGRDRAAMVANVIRFRTRSAIREVGKALGLPATGLDRLAKVASRWGEDVDGLLRPAGFDAQVPMHRHLAALVAEIADFPRHLSIHPGGFLLGHEPVHRIVPIENGAMEARTVIQWDKDDLEALGLFKVDLLGLGALTMVDKSLSLLRAHRGVDLELATIPEEDAATYAMVSRGDTVGVFQIESRAQMAMLPRLRPKSFYDLVIEVSIVRPGPIAGDMVHPYLRRRHGEEPVVYAHPSLEPVLKKTLGVPLFQEQVMKLAMVAADYTPGEADQLRRDMAAWRRSGHLERHRTRLVSRMTQKGIAPEFAERVFEQIRGFGEYGFPECVVGATRVIDADTGRWVTIEDVAEGRCALRNTLSCNDELRIEKRAVLAVKRSGRKTVYRLRTALGREIEASREHPFLTVSGWRKLRELRVGDSVAAARDCDSDVGWDRIASIEHAGVRETYDLSIEGNHNFLANELVVHNSHAASFALIAYATSWLRCWHLDVFTCALLNAQPMGFYSPSTIVDDAKRHGVEVRPIDVTQSAYDCTLEPARGALLAVRMGLRYVKGLAETAARTIAREAELRPFEGLRDFVQRTGSHEKHLTALAQAGALEALTESRRAALWELWKLAREPQDRLPLASSEPTPQLAPLDALATVTWDYRASGHSARAHPLAPVRAALQQQGLPDAQMLRAMQHGKSARYAGLVICRQRPGTAKGVVFMTLEDETGFVNVVVWQDVFDRYALLVKCEPFLGVTGKLQVQDGVVHLVAKKLWVPKLEVRPVGGGSRDFH